jgi:hypothetical protein
MRINLKFVTRGLIVALLLLVGLLLWLSTNLQSVMVWLVPGIAVEPTLGPTPPPPTILAPRGALTEGHAGLEEWVILPESGAAIGSGFLLRLEDGTIVGVTTAHSLGIVTSALPDVERMAFRLPQSASDVVTFDHYHGLPGRASVQYELNQDFVLLQPAGPVDETLVLTPDPRGAPVPGERVVLYSGLVDGAGNPRPLMGTVTAAGETAVWVQMDDVFAPGRMSGSPLLSAHTGRVVGMAIVAGRNRPLLIGFHPIGSLVTKAEAATSFPALAGGVP